MKRKTYFNSQLTNRLLKEMPYNIPNLYGFRNSIFSFLFRLSNEHDREHINQNEQNWNC